MLVAILTMSAGMAKDKVKKVTTFKAEINCQNCVNKIMNNVPVLGKGIDDVKVDMQNQTVTVQYDGNKNNDENIIKGLAKLNVQATTLNGDNSSKNAIEPYCVMPPVKIDENGKACVTTPQKLEKSMKENCNAQHNCTQNKKCDQPKGKACGECKKKK